MLQHSPLSPTDDTDTVEYLSFQGHKKNNSGLCWCSSVGRVSSSHWKVAGSIPSQRTYPGSPVLVHVGGKQLIFLSLLKNKNKNIKKPHNPGHLISALIHAFTK